MSGYNYSNWGRRRRDCGSQGGGSNQNTGYWSNHYNKYGNYNPYHYPKLTYPQQWNSGCWNEPDQYGGTYGREQVVHNKCTPQHPVMPTEGHSKARGHSLSVKVKTSQSGGGKRKRKCSSFLSSNKPLQWKGTRKSPPLGSEEARKKTLAQATDKIKTCLLSFHDEKSEVLENLLSSKDQSVAELSKAACVRLEKSDYAELQLTPSDLKVIGMVTTSGIGPSSEMDEDGNYTVENTSLNELRKSSSTAEIAAPISRDVFCTFNRELVDSVDRVNMSGSLERETGLQDSSKSIGPKPYCIYEQRIFTSENYQGKPTVGENQASHTDSCAQSGSASQGISDAVDYNKPKDDINKNMSYEHVSLNKQNEPKETLQKLKHRMIQQFLKMGKNNLKDLINNPRSRKFEFAMNHLMKEHHLLLSRELRGLAQSRIRGQDIENRGHNEPVRETSSLLDTDIEINLSHLPQEVIEQLGSLLQLDLLDDAESIDFQPITDDNVGSVHDLQNIQALQVALLSEENIKREAVVSEFKPLVTREESSAVVESGGETHLVEDEHGPDWEMNRTLMDERTGQTEILQRREMECEQVLILDESAKAREPGKATDEWPNYIPVGKGFRNRSGKFGNMVPEFPDLMNVGSIESATVDGKNKNRTSIPCTRQTNGAAVRDHNLETDQNPARSSDKLMNVDVASEASETHVRPPQDKSDRNSPQEVCGMASEILNTDTDISSDKPLSNRPVEFTTNCLSGCDLMESCNEDIWVDASQREGFDSLRNTGDDITDNIYTSDVETDGQAEDIVESCRDAVEPPEGSAVIDGHTEGSEYSTVLLADNEELLQGAAADELLEGSKKTTDTSFADGVNNLNLIGITEGLTAVTCDAGLHENEMKADSELSKEKHITSVIDRISEPSERLNGNSVFVRKHTENLQENMNTCDSEKNLNLQMNINENSCGTENKTFNKEVDLNQDEGGSTEVSAVGDLSSKSVGVSVVLSGSNNEDTNCDEDSMSNKNSIHSAIAEHNIHSCITAETAESCFSDETKIAPSAGIQGSVDGALHVPCDISVAEDNVAVGETEVGDSGDHGNDVTHVPISVGTDKKDGNDLSILKRCVPDEDGHAANGSLAAGVGVQFVVTSSNVTSQHETHDDTVETCYCNVVVKTEKIDDMTNDETSQIEQQAGHEDASTFFPEPQNVDCSSQTQASVSCNPTKKVTTVEVGTQAQLSEELYSYNVQEILQLLEKSHQLSPHLAKSLREHLLSVQVTERCESVGAKKLGAACVSKEKSPPSLIIRPLNSKVLQSSQAHISKIHDMDSRIQTGSLQHTSELLLPTDGIESSFQGLSLNGDGEKNTKKRIKLAKPDDTNPELDRVKKVGGGSKDSEGSTCASDLGVADTNSPSVGIARFPCIEDDLNGDGINHFNTRKSVQESSLSSNSQYLFLKMLEIDKEIQKLMETKLKLYSELQLSLTSDTMCTDVNNKQSKKSAGMMCASPTKVSASDMLCNNVISGSNSNIPQTHTGFVTVNRNRSLSSSCASDTATCASTPMVILPLDYALDPSTDLQNAHFSMPKNRLSESMKTVDTSPVEENNIHICSCHFSGELSAMVHCSDHSDQSENVCCNEAPSLKLGLHQVNSNGANNVRRYLAPHLSDCRRKSDQSESNSSVPEVMNVKKCILKPKRNVSKEGYSGNKYNQACKHYNSGISMGNESSRPVDNQEKEGTGSICETTTKKPVCSDSLLKTPVKELRSKNKHILQKVGNIKCEQECSQSDGNIIAQDKKETVSPFSTKVLTRSNKQSENDSSDLCNTSTRHSQRKQSVNKSNEQLSSQTSTGVLRHRGDTKMTSRKDVEIQLESITDTVCSRKKIESPERKIVSLVESGLPDCISRVTRKRGLSTTRGTVGDDCIAGSQEEPAESRRRLFSRTSDFQEIQPHIMDKNATDGSTRMKRRVTIEQTSAVDDCTLPARQLKKTALSHSGYLQMRSKPKVQSSPESLTSDLSSRTTQHVDGLQKRKSLEREDPPSKVQHLDPKLNPLQWKLQDCFVMVKPLVVEEIGNTNKLHDEFTTADSRNKRKIKRSSSSSSPDISVANFVEMEKKRIESNILDLTEKMGDSSRVIYPELVGTDLNEIEGCSSQQDPLGDIPSAQAQVSEVNTQPSGSIISDPLQLPRGFFVQSHSPKVMPGENTLSTLVYDTSDGEQDIARKDDENSEAGMLTCNTDDKDDFDRDSVCSDDTAQEDREGTSNIKASKLRSTKRHRKDRKSDGIERLVFESHEGPVLDIKTVGRHVLAASEDGSVYCYSLKSGKFKRKFEGHNGAVTCLCVIEYNSGNVTCESEVLDAEQLSPDSFFTGSLDRHVRSFRFKTGELVHSVDVGSPVQCMDHNCGIIYVGTRTGQIARYNVKMSSLIGEPTKLGRESILTLKATKEGPRQVLIIGSRNRPIAVRDAATGLLLRTVCNSWSHTVYSLAVSTNVIYCGTKTGNIPAFVFTSGDEVCRFRASAGVVCLRLYNNLLFAGCYDGNIYVFSVHDKTQVARIAGPGKMLLCMDIVKNRIIAGSKDSNKLEAWGFPQQIRNHLKEAKHR